jgi:hypothetical protein
MKRKKSELPEVCLQNCLIFRTKDIQPLVVHVVIIPNYTKYPVENLVMWSISFLIKLNHKKWT